MDAIRHYEAGFAAPDWLNRLRVRADDLMRAKDWAGLHAMAGELRRDEELWPELTGPWCAVAARHVGDPQARALLDELVAGGFCQPELLDGELAAAFGQDEDWPDLRARIAANVPPPPLELLEWPVVTPSAPLSLLRLPVEREPALLARVPPPAATAWETAERLLGWVASRWRHGNAHVERDDAVACLDRVDAGERFACVEYSLVLSQALNALAIPARRLSLRQANHHVGLGRGHMVSEAWIDEVGRWVVLDGQNGLCWTDDQGVPMDAVELRARLLRGEPPPHAAIAAEAQPLSDEDLASWFGYFASQSTTGAIWSDGPFTPVFQRGHLLVTDRLERGPEPLYPDLSEVGIGVALLDGEPAVRLFTPHPHARGFVVVEDGVQREIALQDPVWPLPQAPGEHVVEVSVRTAYGRLAARPLRYAVR
jgi:hypothetical protein